MEPKTDKRLFLLDAFALIYRSYFAFIKNPIKNSKGEEFYISKTDPRYLSGELSGVTKNTIVIKGLTWL